MAAKPGEPKGPIYGFNQKDVVRVAEAIRRVENTPREASGSGRIPLFAAGAPIAAKTKTGGITAGSISTPSTNSVTLLVKASTGDGLTAGADVNCLNYSTGTVSGANKLIWLVSFNGKYVFPRPDC